MGLSQHLRPGDAGTGAIFKNMTKELPHHSDFLGDCEIDGQAYQVRGWVRSDKHGTKFVSLAFRSMATESDVDEIVS